MGVVMEYIKSAFFGFAAFGIIEIVTLLFALVMQNYHPGAAFCITVVIICSLFGAIAGLAYPKLVGIIPAKNPHANGVIFFLLIAGFPIFSFDFLEMLTPTIIFTVAVSAFAGALFAHANFLWNVDIYDIY
jgi:hypothetical protein